MCKYSILAELPNAKIQYCHHCNTVVLIYNNILLNFNIKGFESFKEELASCYDYHARNCLGTKRDITFTTKIEGMHLLFSLSEVGELLMLVQEAQLSELFLEKTNVL